MMGVIVTNIYTANYNKRWRIYGDDDKRGSHDLQGWADGVLYEVLTPKFKVKDFDDFSLSGSNNQFTVLRFVIPKEIYGEYKVYLGKTSIRPFTYDEGDASLYQVKLFTPILFNTLIPVIKIINPSTEGTFVAEFDKAKNVKKIPTKTYYLIKDKPVRFTAAGSYNNSGFEIVNYKWDFQNDGAIDVETTQPTADYIYSGLGDHVVKLIIETSSGLAATNGGSPESPPLNPVESRPQALPFKITVVENPKSNTLHNPLPAPFIIQNDDVMLINYEIKERGQIKLSITTLRGDIIASLINEVQREGYWSALWQGKNDNGSFVGDGLYLCVLESDQGMTIKKIKVIR